MLALLAGGAGDGGGDHGDGEREVVLRAQPVAVGEARAQSTLDPFGQGEGVRADARAGSRRGRRGEDR